MAGDGRRTSCLSSSSRCDRRAVLPPLPLRLKGGSSEVNVTDETPYIIGTQEDGAQAIDPDEEEDAEFWAEHPDGLAGARELPPSYQSAINQALAENTTLFPGAPYSTRESLEAAAWEFLKRSRDTSLGDEDDADQFNFDHLYVMSVCVLACVCVCLVYTRSVCAVSLSDTQARVWTGRKARCRK